MLKLKTLTKNRVRVFVTSDLIIANSKNFVICYSAAAPSLSSPPPPLPPSKLCTSSFQVEEVAASFKEWFKTRNNPLLDRIFSILADGSGDAASTDLALSRLGIPLSQRLVLDALGYGSDVLLCLKFFDWAGRQERFHHTHATFYAMFNLMSGAKLMSAMLEFVEPYVREIQPSRATFYSVLVMGYAIAGKFDIALQVFGKMRFLGIDLDVLPYHVLLNALVEGRFFDAVEVVSNQIIQRGLVNRCTHSILVKSFCRQNRLEEGEAFIRDLIRGGHVLSGFMVGHLVDALCKNNEFAKAGRLVMEFQNSGMVHEEQCYGVWIKDMLKAGELDGVLKLFQNKMASEGHIPGVFRFNKLIFRLLRENRLLQVFDLLLEMKEHQVVPDRATMNAALCIFCKVGMVDIALELYNSRSEVGLAPSSMVYNYLINTICGDGSIDEAYFLLKNSIRQGYFPGRKAFSIIADALCREGKVGKIRELALMCLEQNSMPSSLIYDKFITALCSNREVEDAHMIHEELNRASYIDLIHGFQKLNKVDIAVKLLFDFQEEGFVPTNRLLKDVIKCVCGIENPDKQFFALLRMQLLFYGHTCNIYNIFIYGAVRAKKPELARKVFDMMVTSEVQPNLSSDTVMLQGYLKSGRIYDALLFLELVSKRREIGRKLYSAIVVGLCNANKPVLALKFFNEMKEKRLTPSLQCHEELLLSFCKNGDYDKAIKVVQEFLKVKGCNISTFMGNVLLMHSLKSKELPRAWARLDPETSSSHILIIGHLINAFSGSLRCGSQIKDLEEMIEQCFPPDIYTYNVLLRRLISRKMYLACALFNRLCQKGYEPNQWTYNTLACGFLRHGKKSEARKIIEEMFRKGFHPFGEIKEMM